MKNKYDHIDLIERYLDDDLNPEELKAFNHLLNTDRGFNTLFFEMDQLLDGIRQSAKQTSVEEKLFNLERALPEKADFSNTGFIRKSIRQLNAFIDEFINRLSLNYGRTQVSLVMAIILLVALTPYAFTLLQPVSSAELYANNFVLPTYPFGGEVRSFDEKELTALSNEELFDLGLAQYETFNYGQALKYFSQIHSETPDAKVQFFSGICYMKMEKFEKASDLLKWVASDNQSYWSADAKYFLALCYIHDNEIDKAVPLLEHVSNNDQCDFKNNALRMLKKM